MITLIVLWVGFGVAMILGSFAHELTHYVLAKLVGAENVKLDYEYGWLKIPRLYVYYETNTDWSRVQYASSYKLVNLGPVLIGTTYIILYLVLNGLPSFQSNYTLLGIAFLLSYVVFGGLSDYLYEHSQVS